MPVLSPHDLLLRLCAVAMLVSESAIAQAYAAAVLADLARRSVRNKKQILIEQGIHPLVALLAKEKLPKAKAEGAGALMSLASGQPETQRLVAENGAIKLLVAILHEDDGYARKKASGAIAALCDGSTENQDAVERNKGIAKLVSLLGEGKGLGKGIDDEVRAEAAAALAVLKWQP